MLKNDTGYNDMIQDYKF